MKNRPFEDTALATTALNGQRDGFTQDYSTVVRWCLENCRVETDPRATEDMPPEPYGLAPGEPLDAADPKARFDRAMQMVEERGEEFAKVYALMSDDESKDLLLTVLAYRGLGWRFVKLPLDTPDFHKIVTELRNLVKSAPPEKRLKTADGFAELSPIPLQSYGYDAEVLHGGWGVFSEFLYSQYVYRSQDGVLAVKDGDVAFDCGACWGGTSLFLSSQVGPSGKVISFEFVPANLQVFERNLEQNDTLAKQVTLVKSPVWSTDKEVMTVFGQGSGTYVTIFAPKVRIRNKMKGLFKAKYRDPDRVGHFSVQATTIDKEAARQCKGHADFIKMDVEGAELRALQGAEATIRRSQPTLAICLYHHLKDFHEIPLWIDSLSLGYRFYLGHGTIHGDETVLFATTRPLEKC